MLQNVQTIEGFTIRATDGDVGSVQDLLFDDEQWTVRYLVVDTGGWLLGRRVLLSPISLKIAYWDDRVLEVSLTKQQVENSPDVYTDLPVSRQQEIEFANYYGYAPYWGGAGLWGAGMYPDSLTYIAAAADPLAPVTPAAAIGTQQPQQDQRGDPHLRSVKQVRGYQIAATDDDIGHVDDFLLEAETWALRYLVIDTRNWWPGKKVLLAPRWIQEIDWATSTVRVELTRDVIKGAPEYDPSTSVTRDYEARLHAYYRQPGYWEDTQGGSAHR